MEKQRDKAAKRAQRKAARDAPEGERNENDDLLYLVDGELVEDPDARPSEDDE